MSTIVKFIPIFLGFADESTTLAVKIVTNHFESPALRIHSITVNLSNQKIQLYEAQLRIDAHFYGLQYFMYYWFYSTAIIFVFYIFVFLSLCAVGCYLVIANISQRFKRVEETSTHTGYVDDNVTVIDPEELEDDDTMYDFDLQDFDNDSESLNDIDSTESAKERQSVSGESERISKTDEFISTNHTDESNSEFGKEELNNDMNDESNDDLNDLNNSTDVSKVDSSQASELSFRSIDKK
jgi:hypothetical protein